MLEGRIRKLIRPVSLRATDLPFGKEDKEIPFSSNLAKHAQARKVWSLTLRAKSVKSLQEYTFSGEHNVKKANQHSQQEKGQTT